AAVDEPRRLPETVEKPRRRLGVRVAVAPAPAATPSPRLRRTPVRSFFLPLLLATAWVAGCHPAPCPTCRGQCGPPGTVVQRNGYEFRSDPNRPHGWHVYRGGTQVGYYRDDTSAYWPLDAKTRTFGPAQGLPWVESAKPAAARPVNYGVDTDKLGSAVG